MRCEREDIFKFIVKTILGTLNYPKKTIDYDSNFVWDIGMNSIDFMRMISEIEEEYDICYKFDEIVIDEVVDNVIDNVLMCMNN